MATIKYYGLLKKREDFDLDKFYRCYHAKAYAVQGDQDYLNRYLELIPMIGYRLSLLQQRHFKV